MAFDGLPAGWEVWTTEKTRAVLAYRPDEFDSEAYPAACMPTIYITKGKRGRRPGRPTPSPEESWYVTLYLEPEVSGTQRRHDTRETAHEAALELAESFAAGAIDYRGLYQVPRRAYLDRLDELTGT